MKQTTRITISERNKDLMLSAMETHIEKIYVRYKTALRHYLRDRHPNDVDLKILRKEVRDLIRLHRTIEFHCTARRDYRHYLIHFRRNNPIAAKVALRSWSSAVHFRLHSFPSLKLAA